MSYTCLTATKESDVSLVLYVEECLPGAASGDMTSSVSAYTGVQLQLVRSLVHLAPQIVASIITLSRSLTL